MIVVASIVYYLSIPFFFFFFNDTATTEIYTLSLHDALPILDVDVVRRVGEEARDLGDLARILRHVRLPPGAGDRKSTRLNSSHMSISYAVFCLKKKKTQNPHTQVTIMHTYNLLV